VEADMSDDDADAAQMLAAHPRFAWRDGMRDQKGVRVVDTDLWAPSAPPDLADAATAGVLVQMLAETGRLTDIVVVGDEWAVAVDLDGPYGLAGSTMGEAAAWALLQVWDDEEGGDRDLS
jgi:hypothetical protein